MSVDNVKQFDDEELKELERKLGEDLQRVPAPVGLAARILFAAHEQGRRRHWLRLRVGWAVAMALLFAGVGGAVEYQHVEYVREAAAAHEEAGLALHIAAEKLDLVRHELNNNKENE